MFIASKGPKVMNLHTFTLNSHNLKLKFYLVQQPAKTQCHI